MQLDVISYHLAAAFRILFGLDWIFVEPKVWTLKLNVKPGQVGNGPEIILMTIILQDG